MDIEIYSYIITKKYWPCSGILQNHRHFNNKVICITSSNDINTVIYWSIIAINELFTNNKEYNVDLLSLLKDSNYF